MVRKLLRPTSFFIFYFFTYFYISIVVNFNCQIHEIKKSSFCKKIYCNLPTKAFYFYLTFKLDWIYISDLSDIMNTSCSCKLKFFTRMYSFRCFFQISAHTLPQIHFFFMIYSDE